VERKTATSAGKTGKQERVTFIIPVSDILRKCGGSRVKMQLSRDCARSAGRAGWAVGPEVPAGGAGGLTTRLIWEP
jgi:hypothetical protein